MMKVQVKLWVFFWLRTYREGLPSLFFSFFFFYLKIALHKKHINQTQPKWKKKMVVVVVVVVGQRER